MSDRARHESVVGLGGRPHMTSQGSFAIAACWLLLALGVLLVPVICVFWALITAGPVEYSGPRPTISSASTALVWTARILASASALCVLTMTVVVTARGGRLFNGWAVLVLSLPIVFLLWDLQPG